MDTKNVPSIKVEETEESTSSTSLVYNLKEGKWQKSLINDSNDSTSDSECESVTVTRNASGVMVY